MADALPENWRRQRRAQIPAVNEPDLARHFGRLGRRNHNLQQGAYPLGSCTMKYNPAVNEQAAALDGFADIHPLQPVDSIQGALELMWELRANALPHHRHAGGLPSAGGGSARRMDGPAE